MGKKAFGKRKNDTTNRYWFNFGGARFPASVKSKVLRGKMPPPPSCARLTAALWWICGRVCVCVFFCVFFSLNSCCSLYSNRPVQWGDLWAEVCEVLLHNLSLALLAAQGPWWKEGRLNSFWTYIGNRCRTMENNVPVWSAILILIKSFQYFSPTNFWRRSREGCALKYVSEIWPAGWVMCHPRCKPAKRCPPKLYVELQIIVSGWIPSGSCFKLLVLVTFRHLGITSRII